MAEVVIERRPDLRAELGYACPECKAWSPVGLWKETEVYCEDCGEHSALRCPLCEEDIDTVFTAFEDADDFLQAAAKAQADAQKKHARSVAVLKAQARAGLLAALKGKLSTVEWLEANRTSLGTDAEGVIREAWAVAKHAQAEMDRFDRQYGEAA